ncbi:hypothetical protein GLW08_00140 [Pontibacillus yanchengensis]|uniref:Uncharacterized protein n=2 Tax=Pontibacillus yanchengensis TaxID=462910 RepID=A0ACC7VAQ6_9BACI|nr:hypothetical protein [Pontibacillus yanchengensis]MYL32826.1 hypothetical protein [Pontibacillus yanchengensis]MYL51738.1 hypothetical protein [Pontibacillus yanchengensis]
MNHSILELNEMVEIVYLAHNGTFTKRKIKISSWNDQYVFAYCFLRKQMRTFVKENILAVHPATLYH